MAIPRSDNELMLWYRNFAARLAAHATALGLTQAEVDAVQADDAMFSYLVGDLCPTYEAARQTRNAYKNRIKEGPIGATAGSFPAAPTMSAPPAAVPPGIVPRLRQLVARIKAAPAYTEAIGLDLGIVGPDTGTSDAPDMTARPTAKAHPIAANNVEVDFSKGRFDGVLIESRRTGEADWTRLGIDNYSPYIDSRPLLEAGKPEVREYRLRYVLRDEPVSDWSDIISATARP
jgi:hypothetical protein